MQQDKILRLISRLAGNSNFDKTRLKKVISDALDSIRSGSLPDFSWLVSVFDRAALESGIQFPSNVLLFRKALLTITDIVKELAGNDTYITSILYREFWQVFAEEWLGWHLPQLSSNRCTHLSNADLFDAAFGALRASHDIYTRHWFSMFDTTG